MIIGKELINRTFFFLQNDVKGKLNKKLRRCMPISFLQLKLKLFKSDNILSGTAITIFPENIKGIVDGEVLRTTSKSATYSSAAQATKGLGTL